MNAARLALLLSAVVLPRLVFAQGSTTTRLLVLEARETRGPTSDELSTLRINARSANGDIARIAIRALGRLERPSLSADILPALRHRLPEVRIEAANALAQAAQGAGTPASSASVTPIQSALATRLGLETDPSVRGTLYEALARLPYRTAAEAARAEEAIVAAARSAAALGERLGLAKALETYVRIHGRLRPAGPAALQLLRELAQADGLPAGVELIREARVRRLAIEGLSTARALDESTVGRAAQDPDPQVRRLAMQAVGLSDLGLAVLTHGIADPSAMVRLEALRALGRRAAGDFCAISMQAAADEDTGVALAAIDELGACGSDDNAVAYLERVAQDVTSLNTPRGWHRNTHALTALAAASPERARTLTAPYLTSPIRQVRLSAARTAAQINDRPSLEALAAGSDRQLASVARAALGLPVHSAQAPLREPAQAAVTADEVRRLATSRARVTIRDVGQFELALFTTEAPGTVVRFARLAESGYYNGLAFNRLTPNATVQGGERTELASATYPTLETGTWPHVRGTVGIAAPDTGDAQFFINLVDNPRFNHRYTVFAQVLNGTDVVDRILEGDIIESIVIVP
jgi:peptidyl-prolyl cis-trans isomerase B (cyclophilin B)